jgi:hypothetical protein
METPKNYPIAGALMIVSGVVNIVLAFVWMCAAIGSLYGIVCCWVPFIPIGVGVFEIIHGLRISRGEPVQNARMVSVFGAISGLLMCWGIIPLVCELGVIVILSSNDVQNWLAEQKLLAPAETS